MVVRQLILLVVTEQTTGSAACIDIPLRSHQPTATCPNSSVQFYPFAFSPATNYAFLEVAGETGTRAFPIAALQRPGKRTSVVSSSSRPVWLIGIRLTAKKMRGFLISGPRLSLALRPLLYVRAGALCLIRLCLPIIILLLVFRQCSDASTRSLAVPPRRPSVRQMATTAPDIPTERCAASSMLGPRVWGEGFGSGLWLRS